MAWDRPADGDQHGTTRRGFLGAAAASGLAASFLQSSPASADDASPEAKPKPAADPASMPQGKIGKAQISRLIMGGNLIGGWLHSRDLLYVSRLSLAYNSEAKIFETFDLALAHGVTAIIIDQSQVPVVAAYNKTHDPKVHDRRRRRPNSDGVEDALVVFPRLADASEPSDGVACRPYGGG